MQHNRPVEDIEVNNIVITYTFHDIVYKTFNKTTENKQIQILP